MFGHMIYFTSPKKSQGERRIHRSTREDFVRFKAATGEPGRWPTRGGK